MSSCPRTMADRFQYSVRKYGYRGCLGTREFLSTVEEEGGKTKMIYGDYIWKTYKDVNDRSSSVARAMADLGLQLWDNVYIFAETRMKRMETAQACFKNALPIW